MLRCYLTFEQLKCSDTHALYSPHRSIVFVLVVTACSVDECEHVTPVLRGKKTRCWPHHWSGCNKSSASSAINPVHKACLCQIQNDITIIEHITSKHKVTVNQCLSSTFLSPSLGFHCCVSPFSLNI